MSDRRPKTADEVPDVALQLLLEGEHPSWTKVRERLGHGSPQTIGRALTQWWKDLAEEIRGARGRPDIPEPVFEAASAMWEACLSGLNDLVEPVRAEAARRTEEADNRRLEALAALDTARSEISALTRQVESLDQQLELRQRELKDERRRNAEYEQALAVERQKRQDVESALLQQKADSTARLQAERERAEGNERRFLGQIAEWQDVAKAAEARAERADTQRHQERQQYEARLEEVSSQLQSGLLTIRELETRIAERDQAAERAEQQVATLSQRLESAQEQVKEGRGQLASLTAALRDIKSERDAALESLAHAKQLREKAVTDLHDAQASMKRERDRLLSLLEQGKTEGKVDDAG